MLSRRLLNALALSLVLHLGVLVSPGWLVPQVPDDMTRIIEARLALRPLPTAAPPAVLPPAAPARPRPAKPVQPPVVPEARIDATERVRPPEPAPPATPRPERAPAAVAEAPPAEPRREVSPEVADQQAVPAATEPVASNLPAAGRIRFAIATGNGFEIGQATHAWFLESDRYVLRATLETTGVAAMFRAIEVRQTSSGRLTPEGFQPLEFKAERGGKVTEQATFDWEKGRLFMVGGGRHGEHPLVAGSQDVLSVFYQAVMFPPKESSSWMVATGKGYTRQVFERVGEERLVTRVGPLATLHVRVGSGGERDRIDIWLSLEHALLPVRIRYVDRSGEVNDQYAVELEYPGVKLKQPPPAPATDTF